MKVCGNYLSFNREERYNLNITDKINKLNNALKIWKGRNLSINGKILIVKTFALSQLSFVNQFCNMTSADIKKVENICYKFIWNGKDRIRRSYLKNDHTEGGLRSIDIDSYVLALKIRNFIKAERHCKELNLIQNSGCKGDDIANIVKHTLYKLRKSIYKDLDLDVLDRITINTLATSSVIGLVKPSSKAESIAMTYNVNSIYDLKSTYIPRGKKNIILKAIPLCIKLAMEKADINNPDTIGNLYQLCFENKLVQLEKIPSKKLQCIIISAFNKLETTAVHKRYNLKGSTLDEKVHWYKLNQIKNPTLRAIRFKVSYNDIFCNERRHKCKLSITDQCQICGTKESALHQLFECQNAKRMWAILKGLDCFSTIDQYSLLCVSSNIATEIAKSCIFKLLIQIDRSANLSTSSILNRILLYLKIESIALTKSKSQVCHKQITFIDKLIEKIKQIYNL